METLVSTVNIINHNQWCRVSNYPIIETYILWHKTGAQKKTVPSRALYNLGITNLANKKMIIE